MVAGITRIFNLEKRSRPAPGTGCLAHSGRHDDFILFRVNKECGLGYLGLVDIPDQLNQGCHGENRAGWVGSGPPFALFFIVRFP